MQSVLGIPTFTSSEVDMFQGDSQKVLSEKKLSHFIHSPESLVSGRNQHQPGKMNLPIAYLLVCVFHVSISSPLYHGYPPPQNSNRRVFEALFSSFVTPATVVPKLFSGLPFWIPHAYFNLCDTVNPNDDSLWAYGCSPQGPGPNSIRPMANIPPPTFPYDIMDDKGSGVLVVPMPQLHPDMDYHAAFWMQQPSGVLGSGYSSGGGGGGLLMGDTPQGFWG